MRLMKETAAGFDPESTVLSSGLRVPTPVLPERPQPQPPPAPSTPEPPQAEQPYYDAGDAAGQQTQPPPPTPMPPQPATQPPPPPAPQFAPQGWSPQPPQPQPAQPWPNQYPGPMPTTPIAPFPVQGRIEALSIAALVTGCCAVMVMVTFVAGSTKAVLNLMLVLSILGLGLGVTALILSLQKPSRFGGIPLAIAGLATGTAALVYYFTFQ
jgi:hypothetical protein